MFRKNITGILIGENIDSLTETSFYGKVMDYKFNEFSPSNLTYREVIIKAKLSELDYLFIVNKNGYETANGKSNLTLWLPLPKKVSADLYRPWWNIEGKNVKHEYIHPWGRNGYICLMWTTDGIVYGYIKDI